MKLDFDQLLVNENAYFFKLKRPLAKRDVEVIFEEALKHKNAKRVFEPRIRESYVHGPKEIAKISYDIFNYKKHPTFLTKDVKNVSEIKFGLFLIVETSDLIAVVRKNVSGIKHLYDLVEKIDYNILVRFLLNSESKFEKIVTNSMNVASNSLQRKTSEATDLQSVLSRFGTSKQIISTLRVGNNENKSTVTINTSRVNSFNVQNDFAPAILWMVDMMALIRRANKVLPQNPFINSFATPIDFDSIIDDIRPTHLLIRLDALKDEVENDQVEKIYHRITKKKVDFEKDVLSHERLFELREDKSGLFVGDKVIVKVKEKSISVAIESFKNIMLDFGNGHDTSLNNYIQSRSHFMIVFDKPQFVYTHGGIFEDSRLLGDKDNFMSTFVTYTDLKKIDSEKGSGYTSSSNTFKHGSLFHFVENQFGPTAKYLICDDLGVEWGDFLSISDEEFTFFHLKHNDLGLSAQNLETVFGQAQKNFGFLQLTKELIEKRRGKWSSNYRLGGVSTSIKRMRKHPVGKESIDHVIEYCELVSANPNVRRKVYVVIDFIRKSELSKMFDSLKAGKTMVKQGVILQMLWFVHGILALSNEQGVEFRILCQP